VPSREIVTHSSEETIQFGRDLGARLKPPVLILLSGELGAGSEGVEDRQLSLLVESA